MVKPTSILHGKVKKLRHGQCHFISAHFQSEDEVVIIVNSNSLLSIHYLCSEHHLLVVAVTREITTTQ